MTHRTTRATRTHAAAHSRNTQHANAGYYCNWFGIGCRISVGNIALVSINLPANNLTGTLPESLARFCGLTALVVPDNTIGGPPPPFGSVTDMPNLTTLDLSLNWFLGTLPEDYGMPSHATLTSWPPTP
jgi:hypothetical protein